MIHMDNPHRQETCTRRTLRPRCTACKRPTEITTLTDENFTQYDERGVLVLRDRVYCTSCLEERVARPSSIDVDNLLTILKSSKPRPHQVDEVAFVRALETRNVVELATMLLRKGAA